MKLVCCCLLALVFAACSRDDVESVQARAKDTASQALNSVKAAVSGESEPESMPPPEDTRPLGPTDGEFIIVQAIDGRKAELKFYDRTPDGTLLAEGRNGQKYEFAESRLNAESIKRLHEFKTQHAMLSVRLKELTSHTSGATTQRQVYADGSRTSISSIEAGSGSSSASHVVLVSTTSPFSQNITVETFYTDTRGLERLARQSKTLELRRDASIEFNIAASSNTFSVLQPTVIVRDGEGHILDFETKNARMNNELNAQR